MALMQQRPRTISDDEVLASLGLPSGELAKLKLMPAERAAVIEKYWAIAQDARDLPIVLAALKPVTKRGGTGAIDCPLCGGKQTLRWSCARSNGHLAVACTPTCIRFMQ